MAKNFYRLILFSIFYIPVASIIPIRGTIIWFPQFIAFYLLGFAFLSLLIWEYSKSLSILSGYCLLSYIFITYTETRSLMCLLTAYFGIFLICFASRIQKTKKIYNAIMWMAVFQSILFTLQLFQIDPFFYKISGNGMVGFVGNSNQLAIYTAAIFPMAITYVPIFIPIALFQLFFSHSSSAMIGTFAGSLFYFWNLNKFIFSATLILFFVFLIFRGNIDKDPGPRAMKERINLWKLTCLQVLEGKVEDKINKNVTQIKTCNPFLGFGIGRFFLFSPQSQEKIIFPDTGRVYEHAHNDLIEAWFDFGHIGLSIIVWCVGWFIWLFVKCAHKTKELFMTFSALVSMGITSLGIYVIHAPVSYFMFCLMAGLFLSQAKQCEQGPDVNPAL